ASFVLATETLPSFGPGSHAENSGLSERSPAMMPRVGAPTGHGPSERGKSVGRVPSRRPLTPVNQRNGGNATSRSETSLPAFGGASMTTRPRLAGLAPRASHRRS